MNKSLVLLAVALLMPTAPAFAEIAVRADADVSVRVNDDVTVEKTRGTDDGRADASARATTTLRADDSDDRRSATGTANRQGRSDDSEDSDDSDDRSTATSSREKGSDISAEHRSAIAAFVQSLLRAADRDGGIGAEVRAVAQSQNDSASTTAEAVAKVQSRGKLMSFLFGTDWKNVGTLRSQIAKADSDARRLETAISAATDASVKADLEAQLAALRAEQEKIEAFVESREKDFSLLGWFTKLFVSTGTSSQ